MQKELIWGTILAAIACGAVYGDEYLKEAPSFLIPCHIHASSDEGTCFAKAFENLFTNWKNGIPGLTTIGPIDPFHVKKVRLSQRSENVADIHIELKNVIATGMSRTKVLKSSVSEKDYTFRFQLHVPSLKIESDYKLKGRILVLNLDGHGTSETQISDLDVVITAKTNLKKVGNQHFFDVVSVASDIKKIGGFHVQFTNLFAGNKELEDSAHQLFNENWRELFQVMRPAIGQTLDAVLLDRYKKIFNYIPARFFISDLP